MTRPWFILSLGLHLGGWSFFGVLDVLWPGLIAAAIDQTTVFFLSLLTLGWTYWQWRRSFVTN